MVEVEYDFTPSWMEEAACLRDDVDPELFFPISMSETCKPQITRAKTVCMGCPVMSKCLTWALDMPSQYELYGVWAGLDEVELTRLRRRQYDQRRLVKTG